MSIEKQNPRFPRWLSRMVRWWQEERQHRRIMKACDESRRRMNNLTREQREELHRRAMEIINGTVKPPSNIKDEQRPI